jgi:hypothetical protein
VLVGRPLCAGVSSTCGVSHWCVSVVKRNDTDSGMPECWEKNLSRCHFFFLPHLSHGLVWHWPRVSGARGRWEIVWCYQGLGIDILNDLLSLCVLGSSFCMFIFQSVDVVCSVRSVLVILTRLPNAVCSCAAPCPIHAAVVVTGCLPLRPAAGLFVWQKFVLHCTRSQFEQLSWSRAVLGKQKSLIQEYLASDRRRRFISILTRAAIGPYPEPLMI